MTPQAMRKQINNLENEIGVEILTRTPPQGVFPSDAGRALYDYAQRLIALTDEAVSVCASARSRETAVAYRAVPQREPAFDAAAYCPLYGRAP